MKNLIKYSLILACTAVAVGCGTESRVVYLDPEVKADKDKKTKAEVVAVASSSEETNAKAPLKLSQKIAPILDTAEVAVTAATGTLIATASNQGQALYEGTAPGAYSIASKKVASASVAAEKMNEKLLSVKNKKIEGKLDRGEITAEEADKLYADAQASFDSENARIQTRKGSVHDAYNRAFVFGLGGVAIDAYGAVVDSFSNRPVYPQEPRHVLGAGPKY